MCIRDSLKAYKIPEIYKSNLATHAINTGHEFPDITNMTLIKHIPHKGTIMNIWENLHIYKRKHTKQTNTRTNTNQYKT